MFNVEITFYLERILKRVVFYYKWKTWCKLLWKSGQKKFCARFYHEPNILLRGTKYRAPKRLCSNTLKRYTFLRCDVCMYQNSQQDLQKNCVPEFPILSVFKLPECGLAVSTDMNTYIYLQNAGKENYAIPLDSCYLFSKTCWTWSWTWCW